MVDMETGTNRYLIKIDKASIVKNQDAGEPIKHKGRLELTVTFSKDHPDDLEDMFTITEVIQSCDFQEVTAILNGDPVEGLAYLMSFDHDMYPCRITQSTNIIDTYMYVPPYSYNYVSTRVTCGTCGVACDHTDLLEDTSEYDSFRYSDTICPYCKEWDCVELEFEQLNDQYV
jgi:hypothetical protein